MGRKNRSSETYRSRLTIDRHSLDEAIQEHPALLLEVHEAYIEAASLRDAAKTAVEETYARRATHYRNKLSKGDDKVTEGRIKEAIATDKEYLNAIAEQQEAKQEADLLNAMVAAFSERGRMISKLADLWVAGYWSSAAARGGGSEIRERKALEGRAAMRDARKLKYV